MNPAVPENHPMACQACIYKKEEPFCVLILLYIGVNKQLTKLGHFLN